MKQPSMAVLVHKSVRRTLFGMAFPMLAGTFQMFLDLSELGISTWAAVIAIEIVE
ncbi:MAG: hypothetical protein JXB13_08485 [Phycisphaerae bacterium]|nr:hypothetical protein [Phycisphaerae bacterium]